MFGFSKKCPCCGKKCKPIGSCHYKNRGGEEGENKGIWYPREVTWEMLKKGYVKKRHYASNPDK